MHPPTLNDTQHAEVAIGGMEVEVWERTPCRGGHGGSRWSVLKNTGPMPYFHNRRQ